MARRNPVQLELIPADAPPAQLISHHQAQLNGQWIAYTVRRSLRRRRISLTVDGNGLRVGAPWRASQRRIESVLDVHAGWVTRKLAEWQHRKPVQLAWQAGATIMVMGQPRKLAPLPAHCASQCDGDRLCIAVHAADPGTLAKHVVEWLRGTAQSWFEQRAAHYAAALGVRMPRIRLSNARTRWGSCHPGGRIHLNWKLIQMPPALIDYVVVHELAHLLEPNHSPRFWRQVAGILPDHESLRRALRLEAHHYLLA